MDFLKKRTRLIKNKKLIFIFVIFCSLAILSIYFITNKTNNSSSSTDCRKTIEKAATQSDPQQVKENYEKLSQNTKECFPEISQNDLEKLSTEDKNKRAEAYYLVAKGAYIAGDKKDAKVYATNSLNIYQGINGYERPSDIEDRITTLGDIRDGIYGTRNEPGSKSEN